MKPTAKVTKRSEKICSHKVQKYTAILKRMKKLQAALMKKIDNTPCRKRKYSTSCTSSSSYSTSSDSSSISDTPTSDKENRLTTRRAPDTNSSESVKVAIKREKDESLEDRSGNSQFTHLKPRKITSTPFSVHNENVKVNVVKNCPKKIPIMIKEKFAQSLVRSLNENVERQGCSKMAERTLVSAKKNDVPFANNTGKKMAGEKKELRCDKKMIISKKNKEIEKTNKEPRIKKMKFGSAEARNSEISDKIEKQSEIIKEILRDSEATNNQTKDSVHRTTPIPKKPSDRSIGQIFADNWAEISKSGLSQNDDDAGKMLAIMRHDHFKLRLSYILPWLEMFINNKIDNKTFFESLIFDEEFINNYWKDANTNEQATDDKSGTTSMDDNNGPITIDSEKDQTSMDQENNSTSIDDVNPSTSINQVDASTSFNQNNLSLNRRRNVSSSSDSSCTEQDNDSSSNEQECDRYLTMLNYLRTWFGIKCYETETIVKKPRVLDIQILKRANDASSPLRCSVKQEYVNKSRPCIGKVQLPEKFRANDKSMIQVRHTPKMKVIEKKVSSQPKKNYIKQVNCSMKHIERHIKNSLEEMQQSGECIFNGKMAENLNKSEDEFDEKKSEDHEEPNHANSSDEISHDGKEEHFENVLGDSDNQMDSLENIFYSLDENNFTMEKDQEIEIKSRGYGDAKKEDIKSHDVEKHVDVGDDDNENIEIYIEDEKNPGKMSIALKTRGEKIPTVYGDYDDILVSEQEEKQPHSKFEEAEIEKNTPTKSSELPAVIEARMRFQKKIARLQPRKSDLGKIPNEVEIKQKISDIEDEN